MGDSSSSGRRFLFCMGVGEPTSDPAISARFYSGYNGTKKDDRDLGEYELAVRGPHREVGRIVWDPAFDPQEQPDGQFFSVVAVRLIVTQKHVRWSVGTNAFLRSAIESPFRISKLRAVARTNTLHPSRLLQWDLIDMTYVHADGHSDTYESPCLPRADNASALRRVGSTDVANRCDKLSQFVEIFPSSDRVVEFELRGQVTLRANHAKYTAALEPHDLEGAVHVFTEPCKVPQP